MESIRESNNMELGYNIERNVRIQAQSQMHNKVSTNLWCNTKSIPWDKVNTKVWEEVRRQIESQLRWG